MEGDNSTLTDADSLDSAIQAIELGHLINLSEKAKGVFKVLEGTIC